MVRHKREWPRNTAGLRRNAHKKAEETQRRADEAIRLLLGKQRPITFRAVAAAAPCSTAWLYAHEEIKLRIMHLRTRQTPAPRTLPPRERASDASKDTVIAALRTRAAQLQRENDALRKQLEVAYGLLHGQAATGEIDRG